LFETNNFIECWQNFKKFAITNQPYIALDVCCNNIIIRVIICKFITGRNSRCQWRKFSLSGWLGAQHLYIFWFKYLNTALHWAISFITCVSLHGQLWTILLPSSTSVLKAEFSDGLGRWYWFPILILCIAEIFEMFLVIYNEVNENMFSHGRGVVSCLWNSTLHEFIGFARNIILVVLLVE